MKPRCPDCSANAGDLHLRGCDVERCPNCGGQYISCECYDMEDRGTPLPWTGEWPGVAECREFGWYAKLVPGRGWVSCDKNDPAAHADLNRLDKDAAWDKAASRFVLKQ